ncbi:MAG: acyl carrier protein [Caldilineaceae bacterium]|nr:acyl carrier protein [Caldilineaceae bacterium]
MLATQTVSAEQLKQTIFEVLGQIAPEADPEDLEPDEDIREAFDIDSFDFLNFLIGLNEQLGVEIPEADYGQLNTLDELVSYLQTHMEPT